MPTSREALEDAISLVALQAAHQGVSLTRTKLVKLLYFVDLRAWETVGRTVTGVSWQWHHYGPYSSAILDATSAMASSGELDVVETENFFGTPEWRISSVQAAYFEPPSKGLTDLVRSVVVEYGKYPPSKIGDLSYDTEPMRRLMARGRRGDVIEFGTEPPSADDVMRAKYRYAAIARQHHETDEGDIAEGLRDELGALDEARRSAGTHLLLDR